LFELLCDQKLPYGPSSRDAASGPPLYGTRSLHECDKSTHPRSRQRRRLTVTLLKSAVGSSTPEACSSGTLYLCHAFSPGTACSWRLLVLSLIRSRELQSSASRSTVVQPRDVSSSPRPIARPGVNVGAIDVDRDAHFERSARAREHPEWPLQCDRSCDDLQSYRMILMRLRYSFHSLALRFGKSSFGSVLEYEHASLQCLSWVLGWAKVFADASPCNMRYSRPCKDKRRRRVHILTRTWAREVPRV